MLLDLLGPSVVNLRDNQGRTALHVAAYSGQGESMQLLLGHRADGNVRDKVGKSPIMYAAANGHVAAVGKYNRIYKLCYSNLKTRMLTFH